MHDKTVEKWSHHHDYSIDSHRAEKQTYYVLILTLITMIAEIIAGTVYGSMALLADGWHMATHVCAFVITLFAYHYARKHATNPNYAFGTGKVNVLGGYTSAIALGLVALVMVIESTIRFFEPHSIQFNQAIIVAIIGLLVNVASVFLLKDNHSHDHHGHDHAHSEDHNLKAAYLHVLADALTSILAIAALIAGKLLGWYWLDPLMGIIGAIIISRWSYGLIKQTSPILLDANVEANYRQTIINTIEQHADNRISDLHVWQLGPHDYAAIIAIVTDNPQTPEHYKALLTNIDHLSHITIEINPCQDTDCH
jgi:cation diffusion facilitator family transporter